MTTTQNEQKYEEVIRILEGPDPALEPPKCAHIVKTEPGEQAAAKVLAARINGTSVEAICGAVFVPQRDPKQLPLCEACKALYELDRAFYDGLNEQVGE